MNVNDTIQSVLVITLQIAKKLQQHKNPVQGTEQVLERKKLHKNMYFLHNSPEATQHHFLTRKKDFNDNSTFENKFKKCFKDCFLPCVHCVLNCLTFMFISFSVNSFSCLYFF